MFVFIFIFVQEAFGVSGVLVVGFGNIVPGVAWKVGLAGSTEQEREGKFDEAEHGVNPENYSIGACWAPTLVVLQAFRYPSARYRSKRATGSPDESIPGEYIAAVL